MLSHHSSHIIKSIHQRHPGATDAWMAARLKTLLVEGVQLGTVLQPNWDWNITNILKDFSLATLLTDAQTAVLNFFSFLCDLSGYSADATLEQHKKKDVVSSLGFFLLLFQLVLTLFRFSAPLCVLLPKPRTKKQVNFSLSQPFTSSQVERLTCFSTYSITLVSLSHTHLRWTRSKSWGKNNYSVYGPWSVTRHVWSFGTTSTLPFM